MKTILYIYTGELDGKTGGSQRVLQEINGLEANYKLLKYQIQKKPSKIKTLLRALALNGGNLDFSDYGKVLKYIKNNNIDYIYLTYSVFGKLAKKIKKSYPEIKILISYQNNEKNYSYDLYKTKGILYYPLYKSSAYNEALSQKIADLNIFISEEDKNSMTCKNKSIVIPPTLKDNFDKKILEKLNNEKYVLFIGSNMFANIEAARYLINEIASKVKYKVVIAGGGMKTNFPDTYENTEVLDFVPDLSILFANANAFVMPIFYGSGAKIKVAEALMKGKYVIGTELSFFGYDLTKAKYAVCRNEQDFIEHINNLNVNEKYFEENRELFLEKYDYSNNINYYNLNKYLN